MLVTTKEMFEKSMKEGFAIGAFNVNNMEIVQAIMDAAAEEHAPVIMQASSSAIKYARINYLMKMVKAAEEEHPEIPFAIHLDHGPDFETCKMCIDAGFTSVMFDGSKYDFEENVRLTKEVVDYAHAHGVVVEAELGKLAGIVDILKKIKERISNTPIVLHGASTVIPELVAQCNEYGADIPGAKGVPDEMLHEASISGVSKVNVDTDLRLAMTAAIRKVFVEEPSAFDPRKYLTPARDLIKQTVQHKIRDVFGSSNKA